MGHPLTSRQVECLQLVARGKTNKEIADALSVTDKTVKNTLNHAFVRLGAHSRAHAVAIALRDHLIAFPGGKAEPHLAGLVGNELVEDAVTAVRV